MNIETYYKIIECIEKQTGIKRERLLQLDYETVEELSVIINDNEYGADEIKSIVDIACQSAELFECEKQICNFYTNNYGMVDYEKFNNINHVPLITNSKDISVFANLSEYKIYTTYKEKDVKVEEYGSLYNMQRGLKKLNYDKLVDEASEIATALT